MSKVRRISTYSDLSKAINHLNIYAPVVFFNLSGLISEQDKMPFKHAELREAKLTFSSIESFKQGEAFNFDTDSYYIERKGNIENYVSCSNCMPLLKNMLINAISSIVTISELDDAIISVVIRKAGDNSHKEDLFFHRDFDACTFICPWYSVSFNVIGPKTTVFYQSEAENDPFLVNISQDIEKGMVKTNTLFSAEIDQGAVFLTGEKFGAIHSGRNEEPPRLAVIVHPYSYKNNDMRKAIISYEDGINIQKETIMCLTTQSEELFNDSPYALA